MTSSPAVPDRAPPSVKLIVMLGEVEPTTFTALPAEKAASPNVTDTLLMLFTASCIVALPVKLNVAVLSVLFITVAVSPSGTPVTITPFKDIPGVPANVSPVSVIVAEPMIEPSFAVDSLKLVVSKVIERVGGGGGGGVPPIYSIKLLPGKAPS